MDANADNTLYWAYKDVYPCWPFIGCAVPLAIIALGGIVCNASLIFVTIRTKALHGTANVLLALCSLFEILHQHGHFLFLITSVSGLNFMDYKLAMRVLSLSIFGLGALPVSMIFTGLDRLFCVIFPVFPKSIKFWPYICSIVAVCFAFPTYLLYIINQTAAAIPGKKITGCLVDITQLNVIPLYGYFTLFFATIIIIIYLIVGVVIHYKAVPNSSTSDQTNKRIFRSLCLIIGINISGYYIMSAYISLIAPQIESNNVRWFAETILGIPLNLSSASPAPVLYYMSKEYRKAFHNEIFRKWPVSGTSSVSPQNGSNSPQPNHS